MNKILLTGADSQLAKCLKDRISNLSTYDFVFKTSKELDITDQKGVSEIFANNNFKYCINCAAYTNVDKAETEPENAYAVNAIGSKHLAKACKSFDTVLIHISTDYVFDGEKGEPYIETDKTNPLNIYGKSKLQGEIEIQNLWRKHFIIRTSWLFSEYGNNFLKTILRLSKEKNEVNVINDQFGIPTYAGDLAEVILKIISLKKKEFGIYHYSNFGNVSWYDFAKEILRLAEVNCRVVPITSAEFVSNVVRPMNSVLLTQKVQDVLGIKPYYWRHSLETAYKNEKSASDSFM